MKPSEFAISYFCASTDLGWDTTRFSLVKAKNWRRAVSRLRRQYARQTGKDKYDIYIITVSQDGKTVFDIEKDYLITGDCGFPCESDSIMIEATTYQEIAETIVKYGYPPYNKNLCVSRGITTEDEFVCSTYGPYLNRCCDLETRNALVKCLLPLQQQVEREALMRAELAEGESA